MPPKKTTQTVTLELKYPIPFGSETIEKIDFQRPKGKHIKHLGTEITLEETFKIASKISGQVPAVFDEMDAVDAMRVSEVVGNFLDSGQKTGKTN